MGDTINLSTQERNGAKDITKFVSIAGALVRNEIGILEDNRS